MNFYGTNAPPSIPLLINFVPQEGAADFTLQNYIAKVKMQNNFPTIANGLKQSFPTGHGRLNVGRSDLTPVVIVPDVGACPIEAVWRRSGAAGLPSMKKLDVYGDFQTPGQWSCRDTQTEWTTVWPPDKVEGLPQNCWANNIAPTATITNQSGVTTKVSPMGSTAGLAPAYATLLRALVAMGYVTGASLFAAQYDHRLIAGPQYWKEWCTALRTLIDRVGRVTIIAHGLGAPIATAFLVDQGQQWKDGRIAAMLAVAGSYGGVPKALRVVLAGEASPLLSGPDRSTVRDALLCASGLSLLLPASTVYGDDTIATLNGQDYTAGTVDTLLQMASQTIDGDDGAVKVHGVASNLQGKGLLAPGVAVYVLAGVDVPTESGAVYVGSPTESPTAIALRYTGDGTVPTFAASVPMTWAQGQPINYKYYSGADHTKILQMSEPMQDLMNIVGMV